MKILEQLDSQVTELLTRFGQLKAENADLRVQIETMGSTITALEEKNRSLTDALTQEEAVRKSALSHLEQLLQKIQDQASLE
ncbi:MAG: cell division protein ZapB [Desulfovibrio sp.]|nr:cell division protein ZapB [Desulfovibrio sp.]